MNNRFPHKILLCAVILSAACVTYAQMGITLESNRQNYLQYEGIFVRLKIRNFSGYPLAFGKNPKLSGKISFRIFSQDDELIGLKGKTQPTLIGNVIASNATKTITIPLSSYYRIVHPGRYRVKAIVGHSQLADSYESNTISFKVVKGILVWQRTVGIPNLTGRVLRGKIKHRTYRIMSMYDGSNKVFYLVIQDDKKVYSVKRLAYEMSHAKPKCEIDSLSRLHILLQITPKVFIYFVFDINGTLEERNNYLKAKTSPILVRNKEDGSIMIVGGTRARRDVDYSTEHDLPFK